MSIPFHKYQGAGNDFVIIDQSKTHYLDHDDQERIARLCDRRFGIGADGLILLESHAEADFRMVYFNSDGRESTLCGNGGRCIVAFAYSLGLIRAETRFWAIDGLHQARVVRPDWIELEMQTIHEVEQQQDFCYLNTGSPHYVQSVSSLDHLDVEQEGRRIRYSDRFAAEGTNVNFITGDAEGLQIATYERGVEGETLACGTGVTAAAIVSALQSGKTGDFTVPVKAKGGDLQVRLHYDGQSFSNIWLCGPAVQVFQGQINANTPNP